MPLDALGLALAAAALHALWNVALAGSRDVQASTAAALPVAAVAFVPVVAATWRVEAAAWPFIVASSVLELGYFIVLAAAYRRADLSVVYPVARGLAPVLVLAVSVAFLDLGTSAGQVAGVALVGGGIVLVSGLVGAMRGRGVALAAGVSCFIAAYTVVDRYGVRYANPLSYVELVLIGPAIVYPLLIGRSRVLAATRPRAAAVTVAAAGVAMLGAYALVLAALRLAPPAPVAAVRESSVIAVALAAIVLREPVGARRLVGAALVAAGVALIAIS